VPFPDSEDIACFMSLNECGSPFKRSRAVVTKALKNNTEWMQLKDAEALESSMWGQGIQPGSYCDICQKWYRGEHRFHCKRCNKCTVGFDHHCAFLNCCICTFNYRWFFTLLTAFISLLLLSLVTCCYVLWDLYGHGPSSMELNVSAAWAPWLFALLVSLLLLISAVAMVPMGILWWFHFLLVKETIRTGEFASSLNRDTKGDGCISCALIPKGWPDSYTVYYDHRVNTKIQRILLPYFAADDRSRMYVAAQRFIENFSNQRDDALRRSLRAGYVESNPNRRQSTLQAVVYSMVGTEATPKSTPGSPLRVSDAEEAIASLNTDSDGDNAIELRASTIQIEVNPVSPTRVIDV